MLENTNVSFKIGENASESSPPIVPGQFLVDAAADKQCLYLDTDESTRIQLKDPTKMDKWGEVNIQDTPVQDNISYHTKSIIVNDPDPLSHGWLGQQLVITTSPIEESNPMASAAGFQMMSMGDPNDAETYFHILTIPVQSTRNGIHYRSAISVSDIDKETLSLRIDSAPVSGNSYDDQNIKLSLNIDGYIEVYSSITANPLGASIRGIQDVSRDTDAANKKYVDDQLSSVQTTWVDW